MPKSTPLMVNQSKVEKRARALCVELAHVTGNRPMQYQMARLIARLAATDYATADTAIAPSRCRRQSAIYCRCPAAHHRSEPRLVLHRRWRPSAYSCTVAGSPFRDDLPGVGTGHKPLRYFRSKQTACLQRAFAISRLSTFEHRFASHRTSPNWTLWAGSPCRRRSPRSSALRSVV
jgi:hypothetical protein